MSAVWTVFAKEVRENLRDRRTLTSALLTGPLIAPLMLAVLVNIVASKQRDAVEKPVNVCVVGVENAPNLVAQLRQLGLVVKPAPKDAELEVREQREDVVLRIPAEYAKHWDKGEPAPIELVYDGSREDGGAAAERVRGMLRTVSQTNASMRMVARGLSPVLARPIDVVDRDLSTAQSRGALIFGMLPYLFVMTIFIGGMYMAIDTTAGERERQSLEPLFANPVSRRSILLGKLCATWTFATASLCICLCSFAVLGRFLPTEQLGMVLDIGPRFAARVLLVTLPMVAVFGALQTLVSAFAKSFREAQTYLSIVMLVSITPSAFATVFAKTKMWMYAVPLLAQQVSIMRFVRGEPVAATQLALCCGSTVLLALLLVVATERVYGSERLAIST